MKIVLILWEKQMVRDCFKSKNCNELASNRECSIKGITKVKRWTHRRPCRISRFIGSLGRKGFNREERKKFWLTIKYEGGPKRGRFR